MTKFCIQFIIIMAVTFGHAAENPAPIPYDGFQNASSFKSKKIRYEMPGFELKQVEQNGSVFIKPEMVNAGSFADPGEPFLPTVSTFYAVDPGKSYSIQINCKSY